MFTLSTLDWNAWMGVFFYPFVRILAWLMTDPLLGNRLVPARVRVGLAFMMSVAIAPTLPALPHVPLVSGEGLLILMQQILIGAALGFSIRIFFAAVEFAGQFLGLQMGLSFAALFDPINGAQTPVVAQLLTLMTALILFAFNGHHQIIIALWESFQAAPIATGPFSGRGFMVLLEWAGAIFISGLHLALPVATALLAANLSIGMMTRAAPQLNIFAIGFPITIGAGVLVLYLSLVFFPNFLDQFFLRAISAGGAAMRAFVP
jgi:flagellar biosynthetic protein FliR